MARQAVEAPRATPPRYGLIAAAPRIENDPTLVWADGWEFEREACAGGGRVAVDCRGGTLEMVGPADDTASLVEGDPFLVWTQRECSTRGFAVADYEGRARRNLAAVESYELANELWTGDLRAATPGMENLALTDATSDTVTDGAVAPDVALGRLVGALGQCSHGSRGMIHVTPQILVALVTSSSVYRDGNLWVTPMGHIVVADDGYTGSGPGDVPATTTQWAYATSMISVRLSEVIIPAGFNDSVDRAINRVIVYAERLVGFQTDECCVMAAEINVPVPLVGPPS